jgi:hypothetical protein
MADAPLTNQARKRKMKFTNKFIPDRFDLVVTRHAPLVEWLISEGYIDATTPVVAHAHADRTAAEVRPASASNLYEVWAGNSMLAGDMTRDAARVLEAQHNAANVRGKHVIGVLPHHLSSKAESITEVQLDWTLEQRAAMTSGDLGVEDVAQAARGLHTYYVDRGDAFSRRWRALARGLMQADTCMDGTYISFIDEDRAIIECRDVHGYGRTQVDLYQGYLRIEDDHGVWGPWIDVITEEAIDMRFQRGGPTGSTGVTMTDAPDA